MSNSSTPWSEWLSLIHWSAIHWSAGAVVLFLTATSIAADTVVLRTADGQKESTISGEIVDWLGGELVLRRSSGKEERVASDRVLRVQSTWNEPHQQAEQLQANGKCEEALALYRKAVESEKRGWARRRILARIVECYSALGQIDLAGQSFAALIQSDAMTPEFAVIPLNWSNVPTAAGVESSSLKWLNTKSPAMRLLGASWLLNSSRRNDAINALSKLASDPDARIAFLAQAQRWRAEVASANGGKIEQWKAVLKRMPESLRAGPFYVVADALAHHDQHEQAALFFMRIPILYPQQRQLAAEALWGAATQLERAGKAQEAQTLYREIAVEYADAAAAEQAKERLSRSQTGGLPENKTSSN